MVKVMYTLVYHVYIRYTQNFIVSGKACSVFSSNCTSLLRQNKFRGIAFNSYYIYSAQGIRWNVHAMSIALTFLLTLFTGYCLQVSSTLLRVEVFVIIYFVPLFCNCFKISPENNYK